LLDLDMTVQGLVLNRTYCNLLFSLPNSEYCKNFYFVPQISRTIILAWIFLWAKYHLIISWDLACKNSSMLFMAQFLTQHDWELQWYLFSDQHVLLISLNWSKWIMVRFAKSNWYNYSLCLLSIHIFIIGNCLRF